ncbi:MAG: hypothetical protein H7282_16835 [Cytophagaceae bacterium]|nr:hypothetical protein [Cytophagaceae bacterium]
MKVIQTALIRKNYNLAAFYMLNKSLLSQYQEEEKQDHIERLAAVLEDTVPYWPDLKADIVRIIAEKFLPEQ